MLNKLLALLADGQFHSGEELGEALGVSRAAVWKQLKKLDDLDIPYSSILNRALAHCAFWHRFNCKCF